MAIARVATSGADQINITSLTYALNAGATADRLVVVSVCVVSGSTRNPTGVTYGGQAMTQVTGSPYNNGDNYGFSQWYLLNAPSGSNNVVVTIPTGSTSVTSCAAAYSGVKTTSNPEVAGTRDQSPITTITNGDWIICLGGVSASSGSPSSGTNANLYGNQAFSVNSPGYACIWDTNGPLVPPASTTVAPGASTFWALAFQPTTPPPSFTIDDTVTLVESTSALRGLVFSVTDLVRSRDIIKTMRVQAAGAISAVVKNVTKTVSDWLNTPKE